MIAWIGSFLLAICGIPELIRTIADKHCYIGWGMLLSWLIGEILVFMHVATKYKDRALLLNYSLNIIIITIMVIYKIKYP